MQTSNNIDNLFSSKGHLNDEGLAVYAEALYDQAVGNLPSEIRSHCDNCIACRHSAVELATIIADDMASEAGEDGGMHADDVLPESTKEPPGLRKHGPGLFFLRIAAAVSLLIGLAIILYIINLRSDTQSTPPLVEQGKPMETDSTAIHQKVGQKQTPSPLENQPSNPKPQEKEPGRKPYTVRKELLAEAFKPNDQLESLLMGQTRSGSFKMVKPTNSTQYKPGETIGFAWKTEIQGELTIKIMDNLGKVLVQKRCSGTSEEFKNHYHAGLYYWFIGTDEDMLAGGRFQVKP